MSADACASELLETVPLVMGEIRRYMRRHRAPELSLPQFRALIFLGRHEDAALAELAAHLGLTAASASKMVDGLVARRLVRRRPGVADRRRVSLRQTAAGQARLRTARAATQAQLATRLSAAEPVDLACIAAAMRLLRAHFGDAVDAA